MIFSRLVRMRLRGPCRSRAAQAKLRGSLVTKVRSIQWGLLGLTTTILLVRSAINYRQAASFSHHAPPGGFSGHLLEEDDPEVHCANIDKVPFKDRCEFVKQHCPTDSLVKYTVIYYCRAAPLGWLAVIGFQLACAFGLLLAFRVLSTTAEDYFSPILTQMAKDFYLPPRLAGVTLMAWGNGAPDIFSSIAAVKNDEYLLALGGQLGAGMFIGTVVVGCVLRAGNGASMRGALIRDVSSYAIAVIATTAVMASEKVTAWKASLLLAAYVVFVAVVCAADIVHLTRIELPFSDAGPVIEEDGDLEEGLLDSQDWLQDSPRELSFVASLPPNDSNSFVRATSQELRSAVSSIELQNSKQGSPFAAADCVASFSSLSPRDPNHSMPLDAQSTSDARLVTPATQPPATMLPPRRASTSAVTALEREQSSICGRQGSGGSMRSLRQQHHHSSQRTPSRQRSSSVAGDGDVSYQQMLHMPASEYRKRAWAALSDKPSFRRLSLAKLAGAIPPQPRHAESHVSIDNCYLDTPEVQAALDHAARTSAAASTSQRVEDAGGAAIPEDNCISEATAFSSRASSGDGHSDASVGQSLQEQQASVSSHTEVLLSRLLAVATAVEWPLTVVRRATIPLIEQESYSRPWMLVSIACCPIAVAIYWQSSWAMTAVAAAFGLAVSAAAHLTTQGPAFVSSPPEWSCGSPLPVGAVLLALCGFAMACLWINAFANELVGLLQFFGVLARVPNLLLGLTLLAWGNSVPDLITDVAMARSGFGNMAMTACFAGPLCNMLCGLGLGFLLQIMKSSQSYTPVVLPWSVATDAVIITLNCVLMLALGLLNGGQLPARAANALTMLYIVYLTITLVVQFA